MALDIIGMPPMVSYDRAASILTRDGTVYIDRTGRLREDNLSQRRRLWKQTAAIEFQSGVNSFLILAVFRNFF